MMASLILPVGTSPEWGGDNGDTATFWGGWPRFVTSVATCHHLSPARIGRCGWFQGKTASARCTGRSETANAALHGAFVTIVTMSPGGTCRTVISARVTIVTMSPGGMWELVHSPLSYRARRRGPASWGVSDGWSSKNPRGEAVWCQDAEGYAVQGARSAQWSLPQPRWHVYRGAYSRGQGTGAGGSGAWP